MERNRTPKFRAYHEEYGMRDVIGMYWRRGRLDISLANGIGSPIRTTYAKVSLMQSTGLFDKNGIEVFEGDIIRNTRLSKLFLAPAVKSDGIKWIYEFDNEDIEVIGNMHENKELLHDDETWEW